MLLQPYISQRFNGQIWKFVIDEQAGLLFAEIRSAETREVSFASIDLTTGKLDFDNLSLPEKWLTGLEGSFDGIMLLHGFQSAQSPIHKGIYAFDGQNGSLLWSNYNFAIDEITINGPIAYNTQMQPPFYYLLNTQTGATLRPFDPSIDIEQTSAITFPQILNNIPSECNIFLEVELAGNYHYIEHNGFRIVSLHSPNQGLLTQHLFVEQNGTLVYEDILTDQIQKLQPEAFIMYKNQLIYIKNTRELKILNL